MMADKVATGAKGLDDMLKGGIPKGHVVAVIGSFGTGKTTLATQFVVQGLANGEKAIFISLEEDEGSVIASAEAFGWDLNKYIGSKALHIVQLTPDDMKSSVQKIRSDLPDKIQQFGATRIAMDSVSLFSMLFESPLEQRTSLFQLARTIKASGATSMFTAEAGQGKGSRDGLVEYVADGVIFLRLYEDERNSTVQPVIQILKMRRTEHMRQMRPYTIGASGITVHPETNIIT
jgi:KaiC domain protein